MIKGDGNGDVPYVVYTDADLIKLRKIRDTLGCIWGSPRLNTEEQSVLARTLVEIGNLPGIKDACLREARRINLIDQAEFGTRKAWESFY